MKFRLVIKGIKTVCEYNKSFYISLEMFTVIFIVTLAKRKFQRLLQNKITATVPG